jgi:hypothetical protein
MERRFVLSEAEGRLQRGSLCLFWSAAALRRFTADVSFNRYVEQNIDQNIPLSFPGVKSRI